MLKSLYNWTLALAARETAEVWLAVIAFVESSVFLIPADVLFLPMALARPARAYRCWAASPDTCWATTPSRPSPNLF